MAIMMPEICRKPLNEPHDLKIISCSGKTQLFLDGEDISKNCSGYQLTQDGAGEASIDLRLTVRCRDVEVVVDGFHKKRIVRELFSFDGTHTISEE